MVIEAVALGYEGHRAEPLFAVVVIENSGR
jgi:hypothetical protein